MVNNFNKYKLDGSSNDLKIKELEKEGSHINYSILTQCVEKSMHNSSIILKSFFVEKPVVCEN